MEGVCLAEALQVGDYLTVVSDRMTPEGRRPGEGYARIEGLEHIAGPSFLDPDSTDMYTNMADTIVAVRCQGMPGPVLLRAGDQWVLTEVDPERLAWDAEHLSWPAGKPVFVGGQVPQEVHWDRGDLAGPAGVAPKKVGEPPARRATSFTKPASTLRTGDYLQTHTQFPEGDRGTDEGYHRVEWTGHLTGERIAGLLADPAWAGCTVTLVSVHGLAGMLVLPETDVRVLVQPNIERVRSDEKEVWHDGPFFELTDVVEPDPGLQDAQDAAYRPAAPEDEVRLYSSLFSNPERRTLYLDGVTGVRAVPAAALPWPHGLFKCKYADRGKQLAQTYPGGRHADQTAHAELFASLTEEEFTACPYHQADWQAITEAVLALAEVDEDEEPNRASELYAMDHLSPRDREWARRLLGDHIWWDEGSDSLTNGLAPSLCDAAGCGRTSTGLRTLSDWPTASRRDGRTRVWSADRREVLDRTPRRPVGTRPVAQAPRPAPRALPHSAAATAAPGPAAAVTFSDSGSTGHAHVHVRSAGLVQHQGAVLSRDGGMDLLLMLHAGCLQETTPRRHGRPATKERPTLAFGHPAPNAMLDAVVQGVGQAGTCPRVVDTSEPGPGRGRGGGISYGDEGLLARAQGGRRRAVPVGPEPHLRGHRQGPGHQPGDAAQLGAGRAGPPW